MRPTLVVQINGVTIDNATSATATFGIDQENGACTVEGYGLTSVGVARDALYVYGGWDGATDQFFNGEVIEPEYELAGNKQTIVGQDIMAKLRNPWGNGYYEYIGQTAGAVETNLIEKSGIPVFLHVVVDSGRIIGSAGNPLQLRDGTPQSIDPNSGTADTPIALIRAMLELDLYYITSRSNGAIYVDALATTSAVASYSQGSGLRSFRWRKGNPSTIINKVLVKGLEVLSLGYQAEYSASSPYLTYPFLYNARTIQSNLLESDADCLAVATAHVGYYNRLIPACEFTVDGNLAIQPGTTVNFSVPDASLGSTDFFIQRVTHTLSNDFTTQGIGIAI